MHCWYHTYTNKHWEELFYQVSLWARNSTKVEILVYCFSVHVLYDFFAFVQAILEERKNCRIHGAIRLQNCRFFLNYLEGAKHRKHVPCVWSAQLACEVRKCFSVSPHFPSPFLHSLQTSVLFEYWPRRSRTQKTQLFCSLWSDVFYWYVLRFRIGPICFVSGLLELWAFDKAAIDKLTKDDILRKINEKNLIR